MDQATAAADRDSTPRRAATASGFIVTFDRSSGTDAWSSVSLAVHGEQTLEFVAPEGGTLAPALMEGLLMSEGFIVANDWETLGDVNSALVVDGFAFEVVPPSGQEAPRTIAVLKSSRNGSIVDLIERPEVWFAPDQFIVDGEIQAVQAAVRDAVDTALGAEGDPNDPFVDFRTFVTDPRWTGVVFFCVPVNANNMPDDRKILFAGIDGQLYAHHVGFGSNRIRIDEEGSPGLAQSSLFGVVHHRQTPPSSPGRGWAPPSFTLLELTVQIRNAAVCRFAAQGAMNLSNAFGGLAEQLLVDGTYQRRGSASTVNFRRDLSEDVSLAVLDGDPSAMTKDCDHVLVRRVSLTPADSPADRPDLVSARVALIGRLGSDEHADVEVGLNISFALTESGANSGHTSVEIDHAVRRVCR